MLSLKKIVCPTDFSPLSVQGVEYGAELARQFDSQLLIVHIVPPIDDYPGVFLNADAINRTLISDAMAQLRDFVRNHVPPGIMAVPLVKYGEAAVGILNVAQEEKADLIVISTHGHTGWRRFMLGSVTEHVLRKATCPVLSVRRESETEAPEHTTHKQSALAGKEGDAR